LYSVLVFKKVKRKFVSWVIDTIKFNKMILLNYIIKFFNNK
jgi:hypothetical protein